MQLPIVFDSNLLHNFTKQFVQRELKTRAKPCATKKKEKKEKKKKENY